MPDDTPNLAMPFIMPAQAQKHVTHNEALLILDAEVQLCLEAVGSLTPPATPQNGQVWDIGSAPTGAWAPHAGKLAIRAGGGWIFAQPREGWLAWDRAEGRLCVWRNGQWDVPPVDNVPGIGVNTSFDAVNRLAVASAATLLSHEGAGHQLKINKAATADTASLLFQSNWSGRAEMGLAGEDAFSVKVSADGTVWQTAMRADPVTGRIGLPGGGMLGTGTALAPALSFDGDADTGLFRAGADQLGLAAGGAGQVLVSPSAVQINAALTGTAVTQNPTDTTAGRVLKVGDFGLGGYARPANGADANQIPLNFSAIWTTNGVTPHPNTPFAFANIIHITRDLNRASELALESLTAGSPRAAIRVCRDDGSGTAGYGPWSEMFHQRFLVGTVSQAAGVPTGRVIERGSNANGEFLRLADGTQMCWRTLTGATGAGVGWTFPAVFVAAPVVTGGAVATVQSAVVLDAAPSATACTLSARGTNDARRADVMHLAALGRWF